MLKNMTRQFVQGGKEVLYKSIVIGVLSLLMLSGCENGSGANKPQGDTQDKDSRILVAYFSRADENYSVGVIEKGNTEIIAEMIREEKDADLLKIERVEPYPAICRDCTREAESEKNSNARPRLKNTLESLNDYDVIYLGMPVWHSDMPMPVYTFIEGLDWNGKTVYPFVTHEGSGLASIPQTLRSILKGATVNDGLAIRGQDAQNNRDSAKKALLEWL